MKERYFCSAIISGLLSLAGCGGGGGDSGPTGEGAGEAANDGGTPITNDGSSLFITGGSFQYDYALRQIAGEDLLFRATLSTGAGEEVGVGDYMANNLYVGDYFSTDSYAPAIVSAGTNHLRISSRIDGSTTTIQIPREATQGGLIPCGITAAADADGRTGVIALEFSESVDSEYYCNGNISDAWVYRYSNNNANWWQADGAIEDWNIFFTGDRRIEFLVTNNFQDDSASIYSPDGTRLQKLNSGSFTEVEVIALDSGGVSPDESYVAVLSNGNVQITTRRLLLDSGLASANTALSGDASLLSWVSPFNTHGVFLLVDDDIYLIDSVQRNARKVADLSSITAEGWYVHLAIPHGGQLYIVLDRPEGDWDEIYTGPGKLVRANLSGAVTTVDTLRDWNGYSGIARTNDLLIFNYKNMENDSVSFVVQKDGASFDSASHREYASALNLEKGGDDLQTLLFEATEITTNGSMVNPSVWTVNPSTGSPLESVATLTGECESFFSVFAVGLQMNVLMTCDGAPSWKRVDPSTGSIRHVSSRLRQIF